LQTTRPDDALVDSCFNAVFARRVQDLSNAHWAVVDRNQYLRIVRQRQKECASFSHVVIDEESAKARLPEHGIPAAIEACALSVDGVDKPPICLTGPATRAPEFGKHDEAGEV